MKRTRSILEVLLELTYLAFNHFLIFRVGIRSVHPDEIVAQLVHAEVEMEKPLVVLLHLRLARSNEGQDRCIKNFEYYLHNINALIVVGVPIVAIQVLDDREQLNGDPENKHGYDVLVRELKEILPHTVVIQVLVTIVQIIEDNRISSATLKRLRVALTWRVRNTDQRVNGYLLSYNADGLGSLIRQ